MIFFNDFKLGMWYSWAKKNALNWFNLLLVFGWLLTTLGSSLIKFQFFNEYFNIQHFFSYIFIHYSSLCSLFFFSILANCSIVNVGHYLVTWSEISFFSSWLMSTKPKYSDEVMGYFNLNFKEHYRRGLVGSMLAY